jgi:hypothetical protein
MRYNWDIEVYILTAFPNMLLRDGKDCSANESVVLLVSMTIYSNQDSKKK